MTRPRLIRGGGGKLSGWAKALWTLFLVFVPWLGAIVYLIVRGGSMSERSAKAAQARDADVRAYVQDAAGKPSTADELRKLVALRDEGAISSADYEQAKAKVLA